jgi:hypothetical protein
MKAECPVCGRVGILETRGNNQRVIHYRGLINGKRLYEKHSVMGINGNNNMGINTPFNSFFRETAWAGSSVRTEHHPPKVGVVGSMATPPPLL